MLFRNSPEKFWNLIASKYAASPIPNRVAYEKKIQKIKSYLSSDNMVLDIGCGTGTQCDDIADNVKQVTGIDISSRLLAIAEQRKVERKLDNVKFIQTSVFDECFRPGSLDVVMAFYVLHFFEDIDVVLKHIHELLKPGGLFVSETTCLGENRISGSLLQFVGHLGFLPTIKLLTTSQLELVMKKVGFKIIDKIKFSESSSESTIFARKEN